MAKQQHQVWNPWEFHFSSYMHPLGRSSVCFGSIPHLEYILKKHPDYLPFPLLASISSFMEMFPPTTCYVGTLFN